MEAKRQKLNEQYPFELKLRFKTKDESEMFVAAWLDGGLDQMCNGDTHIIKKGRSKQSWNWPDPALYIEISDEER